MRRFWVVLAFLLLLFLIYSCTIDLTAPEVSIISSKESYFVNGEILFLIKVKENFLVSKVIVYLNNNVLFQDSPMKSYYEKEIRLNSSDYADGEYKLSVTVYNDQNKFSEKSLKFFFDNTPPTVQIISPIQNQFLSQLFSTEYTASDNAGINKVSIFIDDILVTQLDKDKFKFDIDSTKFSEGEHVLRIKVVDKVGLSAESSNTVIFDNTPPSVEVDDSTIPNTLTNKIQIKANVADNFGAGKVILNVGSEKIQELTNEPYVFELDTTRFPNGTYQLSIIASDYAGNSKSWSKTVKFTNPNRLNWKIKVSNSPVYGVAFDGEKLYVTSGSKVYALGMDGTVKWSFLSRLAGDFKVAPLVGSNGIIYCVTNRGEVYALDSAGKEVWYKSGIGDSIESSPAFSSNDNLIFFGNNEGKFYTLKADSGVIVNTYITPDRYSIYSSPAVNNTGTVYFLGRDNYFYAISNSRLKWRVDVGNFVGLESSSPAIDFDTQNIYIGSNNGKFYCITDQATLGKILWSYDTGAPVVSSPVIGDKVYICNSKGKVLCFEKNGEKVFEKELGMDVKLTPVIGTDERIYIPTENGSLICLNPQGDIEWKYEAGVKITTSLLILNDGCIVFGTQDGQVLAVQSLSFGLYNQNWSKFKKDNLNSGSLR